MRRTIPANIEIDTLNILNNTVHLAEALVLEMSSKQRLGMLKKRVDWSLLLVVLMEGFTG